MIKEYNKLLFALMPLFLVGCSNNIQQGGNDNGQSKEIKIETKYLNVVYYHDTAVQNCAEGLLLIRKKESSDLSKYSLTVKWGDKNNSFDNYDPLFEVDVIKGSEYEYAFKEKSLIPVEANNLWIEVYDSSILIDSGSLDFNSYKSQLNLISQFSIISDTQVTPSFPSFYNRTVETFKDIKEVTPNSSGIVINGDIVDEFDDSNYDIFFDAYSKVYDDEKTPLYIGLGNHEFIDLSEDARYEGQSEEEIRANFNERLDLWKSKTGNDKQYYTFEKGNVKFIFLGTTRMPMELDGNTRADNYLGDEQIERLKKEINNSLGKPIFIMSHGSLRDTVSGSLSSLNQTWYGFTEDEDNKIRQVISGKENILFFSSHSHWSFESINPYYIEDDGPYYFNTGAISYLWEGEGSGHHYKNGSYENGGAQGLYVDVFENQIHIKGRQFEDVDGTSKYRFSNYQVVIDY